MWQPLPFIGGAYTDDALPWSAQDTLNYIPVPAERGGTRSVAKLVGVPGMVTVTASMQEAPVRGLHNVEGLLLAVTGDTLYRIGTDGAATAIGTIPGVGRVSMAHNQITAGFEVMIANGQSGYVYDTTAGTLTRVTDEGFPGAKVVDFVDGYIAFVEPFGRFWGHSQLLDASSYNTLDRYDAESAPDKMQSLIVSHREVMVLNQRTIAFFRNTGAATGTFANNNGTEMEVGCASPYAVARLDNTVYWLGNDGVVYRLEGHAPRRVSTGPIEQAIARCNTANAFAFTFEDRGHKVFYLTLPDGHTWGYDVWTGEWHRRASEDMDRWRVSALVRWQGKWIAGDFSNGRLYQLDWNVQDEAGDVLERRRRGGVLHANQNRLTVNALELVVDTGQDGEADVLLSALSISGDLPDSYIGGSGTYQYTVSGGVLPRAVSISAGSLPPGATMDATGLVTYDYTTAGDYAWTVMVTGADGSTATLADSASVVDLSTAVTVSDAYPEPSNFIQGGVSDGGTLDGPLALSRFVGGSKVRAIRFVAKNTYMEDFPASPYAPLAGLTPDPGFTPSRVLVKDEAGEAWFDSGWMGDAVQQDDLDAEVASNGFPGGTLVPNFQEAIVEVPADVGPLSLWVYRAAFGAFGPGTGGQVTLYYPDPEDMPDGVTPVDGAPGYYLAPDGSLYKATWAAP